MVRNVTWEFQGKKKKNASSSYCGTVWNYAMGVEKDAPNGKYTGFVVKFDTPLTYPSFGDYLFGGFLGGKSKWTKVEQPWSHKMGVTIKKKKSDGSYETFIDKDPISAESKPVEKFYAITEPGEYVFGVENISTGQCAPGSDDWLNYSRHYKFKPNQISGYEEPKPSPPQPKPEPLIPPKIKTENKFEFDMLTPNQILIGIAGLSVIIAISNLISDE